MDKLFFTETRNIISKLPSHLDKSGTISTQLRGVEDGQALYELVQQSELALRTAREHGSQALNAWQTDRARVDGLAKKLFGLTRAAATICTLYGIEIATDVLQTDAGDPLAAAQHIAHYLSRVPGFGKALAHSLLELGTELEAAETAIKATQAKAESGSRELTSAYFRAISAVAQAKAFLAVKGVVVRERKISARPRKKAIGSTPATPSQPVSTPSVPAPAPTPLPLPEVA